MTIEELYSILLRDKPSDILRIREKELFELIPELKVCKGFKQNNEWHVYDVYDHILHVVDNVSDSLDLRLAALFHDVGKLLCYTEDENKVGHFYGHWEISQKIFELFAEKHSIDIDIRDRVSDLIYYHDINLTKLDDRKLNDMYNKFGIDGLSKLYELKTADLLAQNEKYHYILKDYNEQKKKIIQKFKH